MDGAPDGRRKLIRIRGAKPFDAARFRHLHGVDRPEIHAIRLELAVLLGKLDQRVALILEDDRDERRPTRSAVSSSCAFMENPPSPTAASTGRSGLASFAPCRAQPIGHARQPVRHPERFRMAAGPDTARTNTCASRRRSSRSSPTEPPRKRADDVAGPHRARRAGVPNSRSRRRFWNSAKGCPHAFGAGPSRSASNNCR